MGTIKKALATVALAIVIMACLLLMAWTQIERGCPITEPNCVYVIEK